MAGRNDPTTPLPRPGRVGGATLEGALEERTMNDPLAGRGSPGSPGRLPRGMSLLRDPMLNKGMAFTEAERDALGLRGLLPPHVLSKEEQQARVLENFRRKTSDLEKF